MGEICGAISGALMIIGVQHGMIRVEDTASKEETYSIAGEFIRKFRVDKGSITCRELLGFDISTPEGLKEAKKDNKLSDVVERVCQEIVRDVAMFLEDIL